MIGRALLLVCFAQLFLGSGGQAAAFDGVVYAPDPGQVERTELLPIGRVESRLGAYGEKLARWRELDERTAGPVLAVRRPAEWAECYAAVETLFRGYGRLKEELVRGYEPDVREARAAILPWQLFSDDIAFLEGGCGQVYQQVSALVTGEPRPVAPEQPEQVNLNPSLGEQEQFEKWQRAATLFDSGNYDEAIGEFSGLLNTPLALVAKEKIREAQTAVATQLRRQAAGILARKTVDAEQKKKLLLEAWALLNKIISGYPEATIIDKVKQNLAQIEIQLDQLDPGLLPRLKGGSPTS